MDIRRRTMPARLTINLAILDPILPVAPVTRIKSGVDMGWCPFCCESRCQFAQEVHCPQGESTLIDVAGARDRSVLILPHPPATHISHRDS
jgi:hypothetical protein